MDFIDWHGIQLGFLIAWDVRTSIQEEWEKNTKFFLCRFQSPW
jgi:hypothetical protein